MGLDIDLDFSDFSDDDADRSARARPGWHLAQVAEVKELEQPRGTMLFTFEVIGGPYRGTKIFDRLYPADYSRDEKKARSLKQRIAMYLSRLKMVDKFGGRVAGISWADAIGRQCVLDTEGDHYTDGEGVAKESVKVKFDGIYPVTDSRIPDDVRARLKLPPADDGKGPGLFDGGKGGGPKGPTPKPGPTKQDYADYL